MSNNDDNDLDDIFGFAINYNKDKIIEGQGKGKKAGEDKSISESIKYGRDYGKKIGNELGYYKTVVERLADKGYVFAGEQKQKKFGDLKVQLLELIANITVEDIYEDRFENDMDNVKKLFKKMMIMVKVKTQAENANEFEF